MLINRETVIKSLLETGLLDTCLDYQLRKNPGNNQHRQDIYQDAWVWLMTYDEEKLVDAYKGKHLNALITRYLTNTIHSVTSAYYRQYKRPELMKREITKKELNIPDE